MPSLNRVTLIGHLGRDPETRYTPSGSSVTNFSIATSEHWKDKTSGEKMERTEWHNIVVWGATGERCSEYLHKGSLVYVEGKIQSREYEAKDGIMRHVTDIVANQVLFIGGKSDNVKQKQSEPPPRIVGQKSFGDIVASVKDDDIPF